MHYIVDVMDIFGLRVMPASKAELMERELKGFYSETYNRQNEYFKQLMSVMRGIELPPATPLLRDQIRALYKTNGPVQGVVNYIADNVGEVMRYLELTDIATGKPIEEHWLLDVLKHPNDRYTLRRFGVAWAVNKLLYGDAWTYCVKDVGKNYGRIKEMYIIPSHRIACEHGDLQDPFKGIKLTGTGMYKSIDMSSVFESFDYNPDDDSYFGTSKVVAAALYLSVMEKGMGREETALKNGGVANIITPQLDKTIGVARPTEADSIEAEMNSSESVNKTKVLRYPVEIHALGNAPVDLNILDSHKEAVTALCFVFKLPVDLYYGQAKYENAKEAKKTIYEQNAIPMANEFAEDLVNFCGLSDTYRLAVNTDRIEVLKEKMTDTMDVLTKMHATLNEMRDAAGYERIDEEYADKPIFGVGTQFGEGYDYDISSEL